jgi:hypothetical protein
MQYPLFSAGNEVKLQTIKIGKVPLHYFHLVGLNNAVVISYLGFCHETRSQDF